MRPLGRPYLQHGNRHLRTGSDPIHSLYNDWVTTTVGFGAVGPDSEATAAMTGSIVYQTDDGSVFTVGDHAIDTIDFLQVGTYLVRAVAKFDDGLTGYAMVDAIIGGPGAVYDYNVDQFQAMSLPDADGGTDFGRYGGRVVWEQLCVVPDLSATTGAYLHFTNNSSNSLAAVAGQLQVIRLT